MVIEIIGTNWLEDEESKKIMQSINNIGEKIYKHGFSLSLAGTGNIYYSLIESLSFSLKKIPKLGNFLNEFTKKILKDQIKKGKIIVYIPPSWVYTREQIKRTIMPWPLRYAEYPWIISKANLDKPMKILDVGAGASLFPMYLSSLGHNVHTIDNEKILMKNIIPKFKKWTKLDVHYKIGDATKIEFEDNTFDRVFCVSVLEHLEEERIKGKLVNLHKKNLDIKAISEMLRVVKPGGLVILTLDWSENTDEIRSYTFADIYDRVLTPFHSYLVIDKKPEFIWDELKQDHIKAWKSLPPYYFSMEGWSVGVILKK